MHISVVIPVRNEEASIRHLVDSLLHQTLRPDEIVIADNGSIDRTAAIVTEYVERGEPVRLISGGPGLPGKGRNLAVAAALHDWIAFVDAGTKPEPNWLESLAAPVMTDNEVEVVYGTYEPVTDTLLKLCSVMVYVAPPVEVDG